MMSNQLRTRYDIIINGGGIVGFTFLNLLLKSPYLKRCKVLLIEQASRPASLKQPSRKIESVTSSGWNQSELPESYNSKKFSNRVSSITQTSKVIFKDLGVWENIKQYSKEVKSIKVWNHDYSHKIVFNQDQSSSCLGEEEQDIMFSVVENNRLSLALLDNIHKHIGSENDMITWNYTLMHLGESLDYGLVDVIAKNTQTNDEIIINAPLILGCDGFNSKVRDFARMKYSELDLDKTAVVGTVKISHSPDGKLIENDTSYQKFSSEKDTVAALLPLDTEYSSFVISAPNDYSKYLIDCDDETFTLEFNRLLSSNESPDSSILRGFHDMSNSACDYLQSFSRILSSPKLSRPMSSQTDFPPTGYEKPPRLDSVVQNSRASFPLMFGTTTPRMIASLPGKEHSQIALLGDSSHRVHPLAGQGLNLGIQDAVELVKQLEAVAKYGERIFDETNIFSLNKALKIYECRRQTYILPMAISIFSLPYLFKIMPSRFLSNVNRCDLIKSTSVKIANGR